MAPSECVARQDSPPSFVTADPPNMEETYSVAGSDGATAIIAIGTPRSSGFGSQDAPPFVVLNRPSKLPAYTTAGFVGSATSVTASMVKPEFAATHVDPALLANTPLIVPAYTVDPLTLMETTPSVSPVSVHVSPPSV